MNKNVLTAIFALFFITAVNAQEAKATATTTPVETAATPVPVAQEDGVTFDLETGIYSKYVWRGMTLNDDMVNQGSATASYKGFSFNVWYNTDLTEENDLETNITEVDFTLAYAGQINETIAYETGVIYYEFPENTGETGEVFLGLSFDTLLNPSATLYFDFLEASGFYLDLGIGQDIELTETITLQLGANLGIMDEGQSDFYLENASGTNLSNVTLSATLPIALGDTFTITPGVYFNSLLTGDNNEGSGSEDSSVYSSINLSASF